MAKCRRAAWARKIVVTFAVPHTSRQVTVRNAGEFYIGDALSYPRGTVQSSHAREAVHAALRGWSGIDHRSCVKG